MADDSAQNATDRVATDELATLNGAATVADGLGRLPKAQRVKPGFGDDGIFRDVSAAFPLPVTATTAATGTGSSPALAVTSFTVLASNTARRGATFYNDSVNVLYLGLFATTSASAFTIQVAAGGYYELPGTSMIYTGIVTGISTVASGNVRVTELT